MYDLQGLGSATTQPHLPHNHQVLFYEDNAFPDTTVGDFLFQGLEQGEAVVVIATPANMASIRQRFLSLGVDLEALSTSGRLLMLDAQDTLNGFMAEGGLVRELFFSKVGSLVDGLSEKTMTGRGRAFGEMVGLLVEQGRPEDAIELENFWNDLLVVRQWELYCAYPMSQFAHEGLAECFCQICDEHTAVMPVNHTHEQPDSHGRCVAVLQQQAQALQAEIAERKQVECTLKQHQLALEETVRKRTSELREAKEKAELANSAKSTFLASMSHELRTPLNAILGYAQILGQDRSLSQKQRSGLWAIQSSGEHLLMLINDVLDLSKVEAGKLELSPAPVNLSTFLRLISDVIQIKARQKSLSFSMQQADNLPLGIDVDEKRLRQVLLNLLSNAVKFTDRGQVVLDVCCLELDETHVRVEFSVRDQGIGIDPDQLGTIFQPFEQVADSRRRKGGTGLGLSISRQLVRQMGSDIQVSSQPGLGSEFRFALVVPRVDVVETPSNDKRLMVGYRGQRRSVLLVDDVPANLMLVKDMLEPIGFEVLTAENGWDAIHLVADQRPDLIICDLVMPEMDGVEFTRRISADATLQQIPVIITSASANLADQSACVAAGATAFLTKPLDEERVMQQIATELMLEWIFEEPVFIEDEQCKTVAQIPPPLTELQQIHHLAQMGDIRGILDCVSQIADAFPQSQPFAERLGKLASSYQTREIITLLAPYLTEGGET